VHLLHPALAFSIVVCLPRRVGTSLCKPFCGFFKRVPLLVIFDSLDLLLLCCVYLLER
jgi:hypothetical protein